MPTSPERRVGSIVRHKCACGWEGEPVLRGGGEGEVFDLVEAVPASCPACLAVFYRFIPREGVSPERVRDFSRRVPSTGLLPARPFAALAEEAGTETVLCPYCRKMRARPARSGPPPCPVCGGGTEEMETGSWK